VSRAFPKNISARWGIILKEAKAKGMQRKRGRSGGGQITKFPNIQLISSVSAEDTRM
jgi:hypothetical protein